MLRKEESFSVEKSGGKRWSVPVSRGEGSGGTLRPNGGASTTRRGQGGELLFNYLTIFFSKWRRVNLPYERLGPGGELVY